MTMTTTLLGPVNLVLRHVNVKEAEEKKQKKQLQLQQKKQCIKQPVP